MHYPVKSQPTRAAWIEIMTTPALIYLILVSQPTRAAWIEIPFLDRGQHCCLVAAHSGCVD